MGRRGGIAVYSLVVVVFTAVASIQVILQVWPPIAFDVPAGASCRPALKGLLTAVKRARAAAAASSDGERAALQQFRSTIAPEWAIRGSLEEVCAGDPAALKALKLVDRLRYAEEHAVRYEAGDVASLRRTVDQLEPLVATSVESH